MIHQKYELSSDGLDLCKGKLVPGVVATWGEIVGDIENQADLVEYVNSHGGGGNAEWGSITGTITDQEDLMTLLDDYATKDWVEGKGYLVSADLSQYATRQWVTGRGYITSDALNGYATETWVGQQGYITSSALSGYATESWVENKGYTDSDDVDNLISEATEDCVKWTESPVTVAGQGMDCIDGGNLYGLGYADYGTNKLITYIEAGELFWKQQEYIEDEGELVLDREYSGAYYQLWPGYAPLENMELQGNPDLENPVPEGYPMNGYIDMGDVYFGAMNFDTWEFNGAMIGAEGAGIYTITPVEDGSEITYEEEFKPFALDEDLSALASRVSALETNYGNAITITNNILS